MRGYLTPLHASKASAEHYVQVYASTFGVRAASFRLTGIYGPRQLGGEDHGWVANFSIRNLFDWPITLFGTGKQVRDILYATDVASAFMAFFERGSSGIYNVGGGTDNAISLLECIDLIDECTGKKSEVRFEESRFGDLKYFVCDIARARDQLGWRPRVKTRRGGPSADRVGRGEPASLRRGRPMKALVLAAGRGKRLGDHPGWASIPTRETSAC